MNVQLSTANKIMLLSLYGVPANVLFSQRSLMDGYVTTPCTECSSPIATRDGEHIPELCERPACYKFEKFPLACLAVSIRQGGFKTIHHREKLTLIVRNTPSLRYVLTAGDDVGVWIPRRPANRKRFSIERMLRSRKHITLRQPVWTGDERPLGVRRVRLRSNFPSLGLAKKLCEELAYPKEAASAFFAKAHLPWLTPKKDRRKKSCPNLSVIEKDETSEEPPRNHYDSVSLAQPAHPYNPSSPSRRTTVGGGLTREQVNNGLSKMRTSPKTKQALFEIVYRRRPYKSASIESGVPVTTLYVQANRLRGHIQDAASK